MRKILVFSTIALLFIMAIGAVGVTHAQTQTPNSNDLAPERPAPNISIELSPHNPPIILPSSGGTFVYTIQVINNANQSLAFDIWTTYTLPDGSTSGVIYGPEAVRLPKGWTSQSGDLSEYLGPDMPSGTYTYNAYAGHYSDRILTRDSFTFEKQVVTPGWYPQNSGTTDILSGVDFVNDQIGWVVGQNTVLHTTDGGDNWFEQATPTYYNYRSVDFLDNQVGWVVGGFGTILHSIDGGQNWTVQDSGYNTGAYTWSDVQFVDPNHGWVVGGYSGAFGDEGRIILYTNDGGANWQTQYYEIYQSVLNSLFFVDANNGWASADGSAILHTTDGGVTWTPQETGGYFLRDVFFIDTNHGWLADSYFGQVLYTADGGNTWVAYDVGQPLYVEGLYFADANTGWLAGGNNDLGKILYSTDGGQTWQEQYSGDLILFSIDFTDALNGWAVGWTGEILHTETGGQQ